MVAILSFLGRHVEIRARRFVKRKLFRALFSRCCSIVVHRIGKPGTSCVVSIRRLFCGRGPFGLSRAKVTMQVELEATEVYGLHEFPPGRRLRRGKENVAIEPQTRNNMIHGLLDCKTTSRMWWFLLNIPRSRCSCLFCILFSKISIIFCLKLLSGQKGLVL